MQSCISSSVLQVFHQVKLITSKVSDQNKIWSSESLAVPNWTILTIKPTLTSKKWNWDKLLQHFSVRLWVWNHCQLEWFWVLRRFRQGWRKSTSNATNIVLDGTSKDSQVRPAKPCIVNLLSSVANVNPDFIMNSWPHSIAIIANAKTSKKKWRFIAKQGICSTSTNSNLVANWNLGIT